MVAASHRVPTYGTVPVGSRPASFFSVGVGDLGNPAPDHDAKLLTRRPRRPPYARLVRDRETIDAELRLLAAVRRSLREHGVDPGTQRVDALLDERLENA